MTSVKKTGDWARARRLLATGPTRLKTAIGTVFRQEAQDLRKKIVQGITSQTPGGEAFKPLSPLTIAARQYSGFRGSKALIRSAAFRKAITAIVKGDTAFIGIPKKVRGKGGTSMLDVAKLNEFGSDPIVIPMSAGMRRYLFGLLRAAGKKPAGGAGKGIAVVQIPARPFLKPVFNKFKKNARHRFLNRISKRMMYGRG